MEVVYDPVVIDELAGGVLQGYSAVLNLYLRWEQGQLTWHDPATEPHSATFESERALPNCERDRADSAEDLVPLAYVVWPMGVRPQEPTTKRNRGPYPLVGIGEPAAAWRVNAPQTGKQEKTR